MIHISKLGSEIITFVCLFQPFWMDFRHKGISRVVLKVVLLCYPDQIGSISITSFTDRKAGICSNRLQMRVNCSLAGAADWLAGSLSKICIKN